MPLKFQGNQLVAADHHRQKLVEQFWKVHAPLTFLSSAIMWIVWYALVGNAWTTWAAAAVPALGGIAHIYPWPTK